MPDSSLPPLKREFKVFCFVSIALPTCRSSLASSCKWMAHERLYQGMYFWQISEVILALVHLVLVLDQKQFCFNKPMIAPRDHT